MLSEEPDDVPFYCFLFTVQLNAEIFPFTYFDKTKLNELNGIDLPSQLSLVRQPHSERPLEVAFYPTLSSGNVHYHS